VFFDFVLLEGFRQGVKVPSDRSNEFERVAMVHAESLLRVARRMTRNHHAAEDAVQEALLSAWRCFHQFEAGTNCKAWLFKILINLLNKSHNRPTLVIVDLPATAVLENIMPARSSYQDLPRSDVIAAIETLQDEQRIVLLLAAVEGFTCKEIGMMIGVPIGTVMSRLSRGRFEVRKALQPKFAADDVTKGATA
jgi:RNA polymerase sigma-70 factor (ECF subfamily)